MTKKLNSDKNGIQSIGRGLRKAKDKDSVNVYDICGKLLYNEETLKDTTRYKQKDILQKRQGGTFEQWFVVPYYGDTNRMVVEGAIVGDPEWGDKPYLRTSLIVSIDLETNTLETINTVYKLGEAGVTNSNS